METSELTKVELVLPFSRFVVFLKDSFEPVMLKDGKDMIFRMLRTVGSSVTMGRNKGKQAPTIPSEDSTIGQ